MITNSGIAITERDIRAPLPNGSRIVIDLVFRYLKFIDVRSILRLQSRPIQERCRH